MAMLIDPDALLNVKFGYRIYGVMAHLPEPQAGEVRKFHKLIGADDLATKPHCSIDNFWGPDSLDDVKAALAKVIKANPPFETEVDAEGTRIGEWGCALTLRSTPAHLALHEAVVAAMKPVTKRIYSDDTPYWPHSTIVLNAKPEEFPKIEPNLAKIDMSGMMRFESIELIGRVGPARGGEYHVLESWKLEG